MKRITLLLSLLFISSLSRAQSFVIYDYFGNNITGSTTLYSSGQPMQMLSVGYYLVNVSATTKPVRVHRTFISMVPGALAPFTFGQNMYSPSVSTSMTNMMQPGDSIWFQGNYYADSAGTSVIQYCFYDPTDTTDISCITVNFDAFTGVHEWNASSASVSFFPSPASVAVHCTLPFNTTGKNCTLEICDLSGKKISAPVISNANEASIRVSELPDGIYFVRLQTSPGEICTGKFLVAH